MKRSGVLRAAVALAAALVASEPAEAFRGRAYNGGTFAGRSVGYHHGWHGRHWRYGWRGGGAGIAGAGVGGQPTLGRGYPYYSHRYSCRYYGFGDNCPYYELPDWNGPMEIRNPGG